MKRTIIVFIFALLCCSCSNYSIVGGKFRVNEYGTIIPAANATYNLGSNDRYWDWLYVDHIRCGELVSGGNVTIHANTHYVGGSDPIDHGQIEGLGDDDHIQYLLADGTRAMAGNLSMGTHYINNLVDPMWNQDAATKNYVDTRLSASANVTTIGGNANVLPKFTSGTNLGNSLLSDNGTHAGVGQFGMPLTRMWTIHDGSGYPQLRLNYTEGALYTDIWSTPFGYLALLPSVGRVGINNSMPTEALDVTGNIHASGNVSLDGMSDVCGSWIKTDSNSARDLVIQTGEGKTIVLDTVVFDDVRVSVTSTKLGGSKDPTFSVFKTNGSGSQGVFTYWFSPSQEKELYFTVQMPHSYKIDTTVVPHVHWTPSITADGSPANQKVKWGLEYTWADVGQVFGNTTIIYGENHYPADANVVAGKHYMTDFSTLTPSAVNGQEVSSMLVCRIFRVSSDISDTYEYDVGLLEFDIHFGIDTIGSRTVTGK